MKFKMIKLVYFSPTGTTKAVVQGIARGIDHDNMQFIDITRPDARNDPLQASDDELLVVAVPVYMGRVPALLNQWLQAINAHNTPAVCVVVYGNRVYEDALLELKNVLTSRGCIPIAGAAYIGEHSFSSADTPTAQDRPDPQDLECAELFGRKISDKIDSLQSISSAEEIQVPGIYPYRGNPELWNVDFISVCDSCAECGACAYVCPVGAIDPEHADVIATVKCITCCACIKNCPEKARSMKPGLVKDASMRLNSLYGESKEPEFYV